MGTSSSSIAAPPATSRVSISPRTSRNVLCAVIRNPQFVIIAVRRRGGYDFDGIDGRSARVLSAEHFGSPSKDLKWSDEIEDLSSRPRDEHDPARSRRTWHTSVI